MDGTFVPAKKGAQKSENKSVGRVQRSWQSETVISFCIKNASPHEVTLR